MVVNGVLLAGITGWLLKPMTLDPDQPDARPSATTPPINNPTAPGVAARPAKGAMMALPGTRFGISAPELPWSTTEFNRISTSAGARPSLVMYFVKWTEEFRVDSVAKSYQLGALPMISWEPWAGIDHGTSQRKYALSNIIDGDFDPYITRFAAAVRNARWPVAIRLAHEMNGHWYPWSESRSGNSKGEYVKAWRHIHDIFTRVGATNVIWVWSPNILRPVPDVDLAPLFPGDRYVDWAGMVGYAARETTAAAVFRPTLDKIREFTRKPVVITETGARPGPRKTIWIRDFFRWLPTRPDVIGFVWFEYSEAQGGNADWRFTATPAATRAFRAGLDGVRLTPSP